MHNNAIRLWLVFSLVISTFAFSGLAQAVSLNRFNLTLNGIGVSLDSSNAKKQRLFIPLGRGYGSAKSFSPVVRYTNAGNYVFECGGVKLKSGATCRFGAVKYGDSNKVIRLFKGRAVANTYQLVFTNLPVVTVDTNSPIVDIPKVRGTFRLTSGEFRQDTGNLPMGIEIEDSSALIYKKRSYEYQLAKKTRLLDMPADSEWSLEASYTDTSFARNKLSMEVFNEIHPNKDRSRGRGSNAIKGRLAEVIINDNYAGVYVLNQQVNPGLLGLKAAKGTFIYKANYSQWQTNLFYPYKKGQVELNFSQEYPKTKADFAPLKGFIDFVAKSNEYDFTDYIGNRIDLTSVADWYLLVKATQASDNTAKNFYLAKNAGGRFFVVPWNHTASFGLFWDGKREPASEFFATVDNNLINRLIKYPDTNFRSLLKSRWALLKKTVFTREKLLARFGRHRTLLVQGGAQNRNKAKWPQPNRGVSDPRLSTTRYIDNFLKVRLPAMNAYINSL